MTLVFWESTNIENCFVAKIPKNNRFVASLIVLLQNGANLSQNKTMNTLHATNDPIGILWLIQQSGITPALPIYSSSSIGTRRQTTIQDGLQHQTYQEAMRPAATIIAHLQFHLRHEIVHFEFLSRLFAHIDKAVIQDWINAEPTGQYARRYAFLYEFFSNQQLTVPTKLGGNYVDVLNGSQLVVANKADSEKNKRWRVNNNIAGNRYFAPMLVKTEQLLQSAQLDIKAILDELRQTFGEDLLMRSSVWITLGESKASFAIEGEGKQLKRIERFANFMAKNLDQADPLAPQTLATFQQALLGKHSLIKQYGIRQSPVFIGETRQGFNEVVHYIAPPYEDLGHYLDGLAEFMQKTRGQSSVIRSAVMAFGFVYIHPLADGNGRLHRFLFNHVLRQDGITTDTMILPLSKAIIDNAGSLKDYTKILESQSKPLMSLLQDKYYFSKQRHQYNDGIASNLVLDDKSAAEPVWRFLDLTAHVNYLAEVITRVIRHDMQSEAVYLKQHQAAREAIKEYIEMPNDYADRIIRSVQQNNGKLSNKLIKEIPQLTDKALYTTLLNVVTEVFKSKPSA